HRVGGGPAVLAGVQGRLQGVHRDRHLGTAAEHGRQGGYADGGVAGVGDEDGVGAEEFGFGGEQCLEPLAAAFLGSLHQDDQAEVRAAGGLDGAQGGQMHGQVALAVGGAAAVPAPVALGQGERVGGPPGGVAGGDDVVVGVEQ